MGYTGNMWRGMIKIGQGKKWTKEEEDYIVEKWGTYSIPTISKNLGKSEGAIRNKVYKMGLGRFDESSGLISFNVLLRTIGYTGKGFDEKWIESKEFPVKMNSWRGRKCTPLNKNERGREKIYLSFKDLKSVWKENEI